MLAVKAASAVANTAHAISLFNKVWLLDGSVLACNNAGMVLVAPSELPPLGGIDGKMLGQLLDNSEAESVTVEGTPDGSARVIVGRSTAKLAVADPMKYIKDAATLPDIKPVIDIDLDTFFEKVPIGELTDIRQLKNDPTPDFASLVICGLGNDNLRMYTCDRMTINRALFKMKGSTYDGRYMIPLDFITTIYRLRNLFEGGRLLINSTHALATVDEGASFYVKLNTTASPFDFERPCINLWNTGKMQTETLVPIPERLPAALDRAKPFARNNEDCVTLSIAGDRLTVSVRGKNSDFEESMKIKAHPARTTSVNFKLLDGVIGMADRMYIGENAIALFTPNRYSRFVAAMRPPS